MREFAIFLKIDLVFKDSRGQLNLDNPTKINMPGCSYTISTELPTKQLQISAIFECNTYKKTVSAFSEFPDGKTMCIDTETNPSLNTFFDEYYYHSVSEIERLFKLLRWQYSLGTGELKHLSQDIYWSFDKERWKSVMRSPSVENVRATVVNEKPLDAALIKELMENGKAEPIFLELLREANSISHTNLESAFVIAVSALEVAVKYLIKNHLPATEWLIDEMPSPPIEKIIREFFPQLIPSFNPEKDKIEILKSVISIRNKIVHSGKVKNERKTLFKMMNFINDFINQTIAPNLK